MSDKLNRVREEFAYFQHFLFGVSSAFLSRVLSAQSDSIRRGMCVKSLCSVAFLSWCIVG